MARTCTTCTHGYSLGGAFWYCSWTPPAPLAFAHAPFLSIVRATKHSMVTVDGNRSTENCPQWKEKKMARNNPPVANKITRWRYYPEAKKYKLETTAGMDLVSWGVCWKLQTPYRDIKWGCYNFYDGETKHRRTLKQAKAIVEKSIRKFLRVTLKELERD